MEKKKYYPDIDQNLNFAEMEKKILEFWNKNEIFKKSIDIREANDNFVFYDGPPFASGLPHYGHLLAGYIKDTFSRYQTMKGKKVERVFGWDCHGLPAEMGVEKESGISGRKAIEDYGIDKFNDLCKTSVLKYVKEWKNYVNRSGRWVDFDNGYKTMDINYMESVIWVFKELYKKGLLYEDYRVMPYSWTCQTPLSNFETKQDNSYREKADKAITVKFKLKTVPNFIKTINNSINKVYVLAWTTTPWTLPSNLALTINKNFDYVLVHQNEEFYIIGKEVLNKYKKELSIDGNGEFNILGEFKGENLLGLNYEPLMPYLTNLNEVKNCQNCFTIIHGDFVTTADGTGIVHTAPGFGEDDNVVCKPLGIPTICPVDDAGKFVYPVEEFAGIQVFETNEPIIIKLKNEGKWLKTEQYLHNYPHCWRTDAPLIYRALPSWYVKVETIKDKMIANNQKINWMPSHLKDGRFGKWLEGARDWSISRNRFFGCPVPVWKSDNPKYPRIDVYGSIAELEKDFGVKVTDLHRPFIDELKRPNPDDPTGKSMMIRVTDVLDCWFESGSMPYAQSHYPFENKEKFEKNFPADFITEGDGQLRGWFYVLLILSTALFDKPPYKNVISYGMIVDETGKKLSKRLRNYVDPLEACNTYGSDAMRWFMLKSPVTKGEEMKVDKEGKDMKESLRMSIKPIINSYNFFCMYANSDGIKAENLINKELYYVKKGINEENITKDAQFVRNEVFTKEQGIAEKDDLDGHDFDNNIVHYVVYKENNPVANIRVSLKDNIAILQRVSTIKEYRNRGISGKLISIIIDDISKTNRINKISIDAQSHLEKYYEKFGFKTISKEFEEVGIKHIKMEANISNVNYKNPNDNLILIDNTMDIYILSKMKHAIENIRTSMDNYSVSTACKEVENFFETLNNWYIRRNKDRFWKSEHDNDKIQAYNILYTVLVNMVEAFAPLMPFTTEFIWKGLHNFKNN